jgi:hypothetical protein
MAVFLNLYTDRLFTDTSKKLFVKIWDIVNEKNDHVKDIIDSLDLIPKVEIVESVVRDLNEDLKICHRTPNHTVQLALNQLMNIVDNIHNDLKKIKEGIEYHKTLWFHSFRTPAYLELIEKIKSDKNILDSRLENLALVTSIFIKLQTATSAPIIDPN